MRRSLSARSRTAAQSESGMSLYAVERGQSSPVAVEMFEIAVDIGGCHK